MVLHCSSDAMFLSERHDFNFSSSFFFSIFIFVVNWF